MNDDRDLSDFSNVSRLFPLPKVVLFPHAIMPLHIFEPRYRQMTEDALGTDKLVTIVQLRDPSSSQATGEPAIEDVGCLGRIIKHERLPDGRFTFLLLGRKRVRLTREIPSDRLYRLAEVEILEDEEPPADCESLRAELAALFRRTFVKEHELDPDISDLLEADMPLGVLTDIMAHALSLPADLKQQLLNEPRTSRRAGLLLSLLMEIARTHLPPPFGAKSFPPAFSEN